MADSPDTVVLIHGLWMTPRSWEHWVERYESRGFKVLAPAWPGMEGEVEALNARPVADRHARRRADRRPLRGDHPRASSPPIIMGHSLGGTMTQLLLDRGLGAAGVGVASGTVKGVLDLPLSTLKASSPVLLNPFNRGKAVPLDEKQFHYAFANTLSQEESDADLRALPRAGRGHGALRGRLRQPPPPCRRRRWTSSGTTAHRCCSSRSARTTSSRPRPAGTTREKYEDSKAITAFQEFPGRPHFPGAPGWEEVADYALTWATENAAARTSVGAV